MWRRDEAARRAGLRRFKRRHLLRIGARDVLDLGDLQTTQRELAHVADACIEGALRGRDASVPFAVIGVGRLGGEELSYASDVDLLFVYDGDGANEFDAAERLATALVQALGATTDEGQVFGIDANLRPEGKQGPLARSLRGYERYYERWALPWEFQSLLRARAVAGDADVANRFLDLVRPFVYRDEYAESDVREIRRIKARIERERIKPGEDPQFHLKLGRGSLSDIEFTVQLLQLMHGAAPRGAAGDVDGRRARPARGSRAARRRRRREPPRRLPVLRTGAQRAVPVDQRRERLTAGRQRARPSRSVVCSVSCNDRRRASATSTAESRDAPAPSSNASSTAAPDRTGSR